MSGIVEWVKNYSMIFLLMTIITSVTAKKEYRKYIRLFVEIVLVITLIHPFFLVMGKEEDFFEKISYDSFWQGLEGIRLDLEKMDFVNSEYYISYYENSMEEDVKLLAENSGYKVIDAKVFLNENYEVETMELKVAREQIENIIIGSIEEKPQSMELTALKEKIAGYYQIDPEKIYVMD